MQESKPINNRLPTITSRGASILFPILLLSLVKHVLRKRPAVMSAYTVRVFRALHRFQHFQKFLVLLAGSFDDLYIPYTAAG